MGLKEAWHGLISKTENNIITTSDERSAIKQIADADDLFPIVKIPETSIQRYRKIPIEGLASLGTAFSMMPVAARTITQTKTISSASKEPLFRAINYKNVSGFLRMDQYGTVGNIMQINDQGKKVIAGRMKFKPIDNLSSIESTSTTLPFDPTIMVVAVAVMAVEQKLDKIQESIENVIQFLELDKQAAQRGNLKKLAEIAEDYKEHCEDKSFCENRNIIVQCIQTKALADIDFYKEQISSQLKKQKGLHLSPNADSLMNSIICKLSEYQLSCYLYSYSTFMDTMLRMDFSSKNIERCKNKMTVLAREYDTLFSDCYSQIEKYHQSAVDSKIIDGIGAVIKGMGKTVGSIPKISDTQFDEALIEAGQKLNKKNSINIDRKLETVEQFKDNHIKYFLDNLSSVDLMYNGENAMLTDGENLYVLQNK